MTSSFAKATYRQRVTHFAETLDVLTAEDKDWVPALPLPLLQGERVGVRGASTSERLADNS